MARTITKAEALEALKTQVSKTFLDGMVARMEMSFFKYGDVAEAYPHKIDAMASLKQRLKRYHETKNTEFLIDAANFCMIEFMFPRLPGAFFTPTDSDQSPGRITTLGIETDRPNVVEYTYSKEGD
jgi:hypothetical protein